MAKPKRPPAKLKPKRSNGSSGTTIDAQKEALREREEKVAAKVQKLASFVEGAPELKKQREAQRRVELEKQRAKGGQRLDVATLVDIHRPDLPVTTRSSRGRLKAEKRQERITFFGLLIALLVLAFWVWTFVR
jgi:hypothetical protein